MTQPMMQQGSVSALLDTRQRTHGDFRDNGRIMQTLKDAMRRTGKNWVEGRLLPYQREALDMIQHKVGRILSGDPDYLDHWVDIAGYAERVASFLRPIGVARAVRNSPPPLDDVGGGETYANMDPEDPDRPQPLGEGGSFLSRPPRPR